MCNKKEKEWSEKARSFATELHELLVKYDATIDCELSDRAIIFIVSGDTNVYFGGPLDKNSLSKFKVWD